MVGVGICVLMVGRYRTAVQSLRSTLLRLRLARLPHTNDSYRYSTYKCFQRRYYNLGGNPPQLNVALIHHCCVTLFKPLGVVIGIFKRVENCELYCELRSYVGFGVGACPTERCGCCCESCRCDGCCSGRYACWAGAGMKRRFEAMALVRLEGTKQVRLAGDDQVVKT